jgi:acyl-homoserine-lactone acylase
MKHSSPAATRRWSKGQVARLAVPLLAPLSALLVAACSDSDDPVVPPPPLPAPTYTITRSPLGVPHITAPTFELAARGLGDVYAQDNFCLLQQAVLMVNGERSRVFGPEAPTLDADRKTNNLESDVFHRFMVETGKARALLDSAPVVRQAMQAYAQGANDYFKRTPREQLDQSCIGFAREITLDDMARIHLEKLLRAGSVSFLTNITQQVITKSAAAAAPVQASTAYPGTEDIVKFRPLASNGWAFGRDVVSDGKGLLLGNPHFPWTGTERFYQARMTVPGQFDVSGVTLTGVPVIALGYNKQVAWMHTFSAARRFTIHELTLKPGEPQTYLVDGAERKLTAVSIEVPLPGGDVHKRTLYRSDMGPVLSVPQLGLTWTPERAYVIQDVNDGNNRALETWVRMASVKSVRELRELISRDQSIPYFNTIASDDSGEVLYADIGAVPKVERADIERCKPSPAAAALLSAASIVVLKGSDSSCNWKPAAGAPFTAGLLPAERMPSVIRTDYVVNSNDSYWLANPAHEWPADLSPILGPVGRPQGLRTRLGLQTVQARLAGTDGLPGNQFDRANLIALWSRNDSMAAKMVLDDLLTSVCGADRLDSLATSCQVLRTWDRGFTLDARGAVLFREFWRGASVLPAIFRVAFDPADPINTPTGLKQDAGSRKLLEQALLTAVTRLNQNGFAENVSLRQTQITEQGGRLVPVPGGEEFEGVLNKITSAPLDKGRYVPMAGTTYVQFLSLGGTSAKAEPNGSGFLSYSLSTDPKSPFAGNQIEFFSTLTPQALPDLR